MSWVSPLSGATLSGIVQLTTNIADNSGIFSIHYMIGGQDISGDGTTSPYTYTFDTHTLSG
ncbi:MAG: Ig-like domain-containing protein [Patescibacteria group bacterium]